MQESEERRQSPMEEERRQSPTEEERRQTSAEEERRQPPAEQEQQDGGTIGQTTAPSPAPDAGSSSVGHTERAEPRQDDSAPAATEDPREETKEAPVGRLTAAFRTCRHGIAVGAHALAQGTGVVYRPVRAFFRGTVMTEEDKQTDTFGRPLLTHTGRVRSVSDFMDRYQTYLIAPVILLSLFFLMLAWKGIYPFRADRCMSQYDLLAQIAPFIEHMYAVFDGRSSLFHSYYILGGADVFGTLAYFIISPFSFLFLVCGPGNVYFATSYVVAAKLCVIATVAIWYIRRMCPRVTAWQTVLCSLLYAYCGYFFMANTYINWLDLLIWLPVVAVGFSRLVRQGKGWMFSLGLAAMIYTCFSLACFSLFLIYPILCFYVLLACEKGRKKELFLRVIGGLCRAVFLALPLLVPALMAYTVSGRNTGLFSNIFESHNSDVLYAKISYVLYDAVFLLFTVFYFLKRGLKDGYDRFLLVSGIIILTPVFVDEACLLMNAGSYYAYSLRFGFLNSFYVFHIATRYLNGIVTRPRPTVEGKKLVFRRLRTALSCVAVSLLTVGGIYLLLVVYLKYGSNAQKNDILSVFRAIHPSLEQFLLNSVARLTEIYEKFGSETTTLIGAFAHGLGGLEMVCVLLLAVAAIFGVGALLVRLRAWSVRAMTATVSVFLLFSALASSLLTVEGNTFNPIRYNEYKALAQMVALEDDRDARTYRIKDVNDALTANIPFTAGTSSYSVFSSVISRENFVLPDFFKYGGNGTNTIKSYNGNLFGDCLMGYRYFFYQKEALTLASDEEGLALNRNYLNIMEGVETQYFRMYENPYAFPLCFTVPSPEMVLGDGGLVSRYNALAAFLGGEDGVTERYEIESRHIVYDEETDSYRVRVRTVAEGQYFLVNELGEDIPLVYTYNKDNFERGKNVYEMTADVSLGYSRASSVGGYYSMWVRAKDGRPLTQEQLLEGLHYEVMTTDCISALSESVNARAQDITFDGETIQVHVSDATAGSALYLSYTALSGNRAYVNGERVDMVDNELNLMVVPLVEGENVIEITYHSPYVTYIAVGIALALFAFGVWYLLRRSVLTGHAVLTMVGENALCVAGIILFACVIGFFYLFPFGVMLYHVLPFFSQR